MPGKKFNKISLLGSLLVSVLVLAFYAFVFITLEVISTTMWKTDLMAVGSVAVLIGFSAVVYHIGRRLRGNYYYLIDHYLAGFTICGLGALLLVSVTFVINAFIGYQPWITNVMLPILLVEVACVQAVVVLLGMINDAPEDENT